MDVLNLPKPRNRKLFFGKQVDQESIEEISKEIILINDDDILLSNLYQVYELEYKPKPIQIYIDSYGGMVYQIFGLIGIMERSKTLVHTICTGAAMSVGFLMLIHGHKRFCYEHGTPLYHQVSSGVAGTITEMADQIVEIKRLQDKVEEMVLRKTKIPISKLNEVKEKKIDWYMTAEEAKKFCVVDEVI